MGILPHTGLNQKASGDPDAFIILYYVNFVITSKRLLIQHFVHGAGGSFVF
jgi:hypothetical protein